MRSLAAALLPLALAACAEGVFGNDAAYRGEGGGGTGGEWTGGDASKDGTGTPPAGAEGPSGDVGNGAGGAQAGTLTAGIWDDNQNYPFYLSYLDAMTDVTPLPLVPRTDRLVVLVTAADGRPLPGATVQVRHAGSDSALALTTGADGRVLLFAAWDNLPAGSALQLRAGLDGQQGTATAIAGVPGTVVLATSATAPAVQALDVAFVLDATGSMGDELEYLKAEFDALSQTVLERHPGLSVRWGLVVYRDDGDDFVVRRHEFTDDPATFREALALYRAAGGGDYPEKNEEALVEAGGLQWRTGAAARVLFHVGDAPQHDGREQRLVSAIGHLRAKNVRIHPVASSGVDARTEYSMRTEAQLTGGRYLFLTDDSGVGDEHKEPTIPCYFVTKLNAALLRVLDTEITGVRHDPAPEEVLRTGGDPHDGACTLRSGAVVQIF